MLEALVRRDFLPKGIGIVTRCPLMLHLLSNNNISGGRTLEALQHRSEERVEIAGDQQANDGELSEEESISISATDERNNSRPTGSGCVA